MSMEAELKDAVGYEPPVDRPCRTCGEIDGSCSLVVCDDDESPF